MKKCICVFLSVMTVILFTSCSGNKLEKTSFNDTQKQYSDSADRISKFLETNLKEEQYEFESDYYDSTSLGSMYFNNKDKNERVFLELYNNDGGFAFEDSNDELGYEQYYISVYREYDEIDDRLELDSITLKVISMFLSDILPEPITEEELDTSFEKFKEDLVIPDFEKEYTTHRPLVSKQFDIDLIHIRYKLNYTYFSSDDNNYSEEIILGGEGYNNYTNISS